MEQLHIEVADGRLGVGRYGVQPGAICTGGVPIQRSAALAAVAIHAAILCYLLTPDVRRASGRIESTRRDPSRTPTRGMK